MTLPLIAVAVSALFNGWFVSQVRFAQRLGWYRKDTVASVICSTMLSVAWMGTGVVLWRAVEGRL